jgi:hypothetical protein
VLTVYDTKNPGHPIDCLKSRKIINLINRFY